MCDVVSLRGRNAMLDDKPMIASTVKGLTVEQRIMKRAMDLFCIYRGFNYYKPHNARLRNSHKGRGRRFGILQAETCHKGRKDFQGLQIPHDERKELNKQIRNRGR